MYIGAGVLGVVAFLAIWLGLGHFWIGVIVGLLIAFFGGGIGFYNGRRSGARFRE